MCPHGAYNWRSVWLHECTYGKQLEVMAHTATQVPATCACPLLSGGTAHKISSALGTALQHCRGVLGTALQGRTVLEQLLTGAGEGDGLLGAGMGDGLLGEGMLGDGEGDGLLAPPGWHCQYQSFTQRQEVPSGQHTEPSMPVLPAGLSLPPHCSHVLTCSSMCWAVSTGCTVLQPDDGTVTVELGSQMPGHGTGTGGYVHT